MAKNNRARRGRGEGAIYQRKSDGRWVGTLTIGYDSQGKRRRRTIYGKTKQEVRERLTKLQAEALNGPLSVPTRLTVASFLRRWLDEVVQPNRREATYRSYEGIIRIHINPRLGGLPLTNLTPLHVNHLLSGMAKEGASDRLRQLVYAVLHVALRTAQSWKLLSWNACDLVESPKVPKKPMTCLKPEEVVAFLSASRADRLHALYVLALSTGLRQGELFGLQWDHVDLHQGTITVVQTLHEHNGKHSLGEPKSAKGRRFIKLPGIAVQALREHRRRMFTEGLAATPQVFCDSKGGWLRKSNVTRNSFKRILKRAGLPEIRFHDLRHTAATIMLHQGVPAKVVQEVLGHSQISLTLDTYSHVLPSMQEEAASKMDTFFEKHGS